MGVNDNINAGTNTVRALKDAIETGDATLEDTLTELVAELKRVNKHLEFITGERLLEEDVTEPRATLEN